jgi:hypothetical protein
MNILVTNFDASGDDVMIITENPLFDEGYVKEKLTAKKQHFDEVYEVPDDEVGYYIYEPCYLK